MTSQHQFAFVVLGEDGSGKYVNQGAESASTALERLAELVDAEWKTVTVYDKNGRVVDADALRKIVEKQQINLTPRPQGRSATEIRKRALAR